MAATTIQSKLKTVDAPEEVRDCLLELFYWELDRGESAIAYKRNYKDIIQKNAPAPNGEGSENRSSEESG